jgi:predicted DNA-binding transcriptional regulator YafY
VISPQRFVRYRDNWYLDAWCHAREAIRTFAADAILDAELSEQRAREIDASALDEAVQRGFGIFGGETVRWAKLEFTPERARWVARERWHPQQKGGFGAGGEYLLEVPYTGDHELVMEILKYGADCVVLAPASLRARVAEAARALAARYASPSSAAGTEEA